MHDKYLGLTVEEYNVLVTRYTAFQECLNDLTKEPVKVFRPLGKKSLDELYLNREVSKDLQKKKEEDMKKAAQAKEEKETEEMPEEKTEDNSEEKKPETDK